MISDLKVFIGILIVVVSTPTESVYAQSRGDSQSLHALFGADSLASNVNAIRRKAAGLPSEERFVFLKNWVLPSDAHPDVRVTGEFVPTDPSPLALSLEPHRFPSDRGGDVVSPVFDLLEVAAELNRLDELYQTVDSLSDSSNEMFGRARMTLLLMLRLEQRRDTELTELVEQLQTYNTTEETVKRSSDVPEMFLLYRALTRWNEHESFGDMLTKLYEQRFALDISDQWETCLTTLLGGYQEYLASGRTDWENGPPQPEFWIPVQRSTAYSRGHGFPHLSWRLDPQHEIHHQSGHYRDYLFYRTPLVGSYEFEAEVNAHHNSQIMVAGQFCGLKDDCERLFVGGFRDYATLVTVDPPFRRHEPWVQHRVVVQDGKQKVFFHGWPLFESEIDGEHDPWLALRSLGPTMAHFRHVRVTGTPQIPETVSMSSSSTLRGWIPYYYFSESAGSPASHWRSVRGADGIRQILGRRHAGVEGSWFESLLNYQRPLVEDGSIEYDFFYIPGQSAAHPALDRMVFLIEPGGVRLHWLTDGKFDRSPVRPDNAVLVSEGQRGNERLPLIENDWNHLKLSIANQTVSLELNSRQIYECELGILNRRTFGLFHFADRTNLQARNVVMRGDWPKILPPLHEQELADPRFSEIELNRLQLRDEYQHSFISGGVPDEQFQQNAQTPKSVISAEQDGAHVELDSESNWVSAQIVASLGLAGDFDVQTGFELSEMDESLSDLLISLEVQLDDDKKHYVSSMRSWNSTTKHNVISQIAPLSPGGQRRYLFENQIEWSQSGRLRIARIGTQLFVMYAPGNSNSFRIIGSPTVSDANVLMNGIVLQLVQHGQGSGQVIWKDLGFRQTKLGIQNMRRRNEVKVYRCSIHAMTLW